MSAVLRAQTRVADVGKGGAGLPVVNATEMTQQQHAVEQFRAVRQRHPQFATADRLAPLHAEAAYVAEGADLSASVSGAVRVTGVLDQQQPVLVGHAAEALHVGHVPPDLHDADGPGAPRDLALHVVRVEAERSRINLGEHRRGAGMQDRRDRRVPRVGGHNHLRARADTGRDVRAVQRARAVAAGQGPLRADERGKLLLELTDHPAAGHGQDALVHQLHHGLLLYLGDLPPTDPNGLGHERSAPFAGQFLVRHRTLSCAASDFDGSDLPGQFIMPLRKGNAREEKI